MAFWRKAKNITPSDTDPIPFSSLYVGTGGDVVVRSAAGTIATYTNVPNAWSLVLEGDRVLATGTTASDIVAHTVN